MNKLKNISVQVPASWKWKKMKFSGKMISGLSGKSGEDFSKEKKADHSEFITFSNICNQFKIKENNFGYVKVSTFESQNKIQSHDLLFLMSSETLDDIGMCSIYFDKKARYLNSFCKAFRFDEPETNSLFIAYLLKATFIRDFIQSNAKGFTRINLSQEIIKNINLPRPSYKEQAAIVNFLDDKTAKIDQAIAQKERMIELLQERKQIIIQNAVTKGLDPNVKMKDSGVEWIGEIPEHWDIKRAKYILKERNERSITGEEELFMMSQIHGLVIRADYHDKANAAATSIDNKLVFKNDLIFNKLKAHLGVFFKSNIERVGSVSPDYAVYKPYRFIDDLEYLEILFRHPIYIEQFIQKATGIVEGLIRLYTDDLFDLHIPIPPKDEQKAILDSIRDNKLKVEKCISGLVKQIEKLKEYKTTLIDHAVTGKIKVS